MDTHGRWVSSIASLLSSDWVRLGLMCLTNAESYASVKKIGDSCLLTSYPRYSRRTLFTWPPQTMTTPAHNSPPTDTEALLLQLRRKQGTWIDWATACQTLQKAGKIGRASCRERV